MAKYPDVHCSRSVGPFARAAFAIGVVAAYSAVAAAADWAFDPKVAVNLEYNDNHRLTELRGQEIEVAGGGVDAQIILHSSTPTTSFSLVPRLRSAFYPGDPEEETDDQFVRLLIDHKGQRDLASLKVNYSHVDMLSDYLPDAAVKDDDQLGDPDSGVDIGAVAGRNRREQLAIAPAWSFNLTPRHAVELRAQYIDVAYDRQDPGEQQNYESLVGDLAYRLKLSDTAALAVRAAVGQFNPDLGETTDGYGLTIEWSNRISETSELYVRGGANRVQTALPAGGGNTAWQTGFAGGGGVRWGFEVTQVFLDLNRYLDPNSTGKVVTRDHLRFELRRRLDPALTAIVGARAIDDHGAADGSSFEPRQYAVANVGFEWRMSRRFALTGLYEYQWQEYQTAPTDARSNSLVLAVVYEPKRR